MLLKNFKLDEELKVLIERIANDAKDICDMQRNWVCNLVKPLHLWCCGISIFRETKKKKI